MVEDGKFRVEKFNSQNFLLWKMEMEDYLYHKDLYLSLGGKTKMLMGMTDEEWNLLDRKALRIVRLCHAASVAFNILKETMTNGLVKVLEKLYEKPSASNKVLIMKRLFNMKMSKGESVADHLNDFNTVTSQLCSIGVNFDDEVRALLFLCSLPESWNDSGGSFHATPDKKYFHGYVQGDFGQVRLGDDNSCEIVGMGKVLVKQQNGNQWLLKEVRHVSYLKKNLILTVQLGGESCVTTFTDKSSKVTKGALVIAKGEKFGTLYLCNGISNYVNALTSKGADATLWHHRLGHMSEKGMKILHSRNSLPGLKNVDLDFRENCIYGK
eukprot:PITA_23019